MDIRSQVQSLADALRGMAQEAHEKNETQYEGSGLYFSGLADAYSLAATLVDKLGEDLERTLDDYAQDYNREIGELTIGDGFLDWEDDEDYEFV